MDAVEQLKQDIREGRINVDRLIDVIGTGAALCSMGSFAPQALKIQREHDASSVSLPMYVVTVVGFALWVAPDPATGAVPLRNGSDYRQVGGTHGDVPGAAGAAGRRTVSWDYEALIHDLDVRRRTERVTVALLASGSSTQYCAHSPTLCVQKNAGCSISANVESSSSLIPSTASAWPSSSAMFAA